MTRGDLLVLSCANVRSLKSVSSLLPQLREVNSFMSLKDFIAFVWVLLLCVD